MHYIIIYTIYIYIYIHIHTYIYIYNYSYSNMMFNRDIPVSHVRQAWQAELAQLEQQVAEAEAQSRQLEEAERLKPLGPLGAAKRGEKVGEMGWKLWKLWNCQENNLKIGHSVLNQEVFLLPRVVSPHLGVHMAGSVQFGWSPILVTILLISCKSGVGIHPMLMVERGSVHSMGLE